MQCFIPTQPAQESLTSNKSHSATLFSSLASLAGDSSPIISKWWGVWTFSAMQHCFCQSGHTFLTLHLEKSHCISSACDTPPGKVSPQGALVGVGRDVCFGLLQPSAHGFSSAVLRSLSSCCVLCRNKVLLQRENTEERSCPGSSEQSLSGAICSLHTFPYLSVSLQCHCLIHCFHL